MNELVAKVLGEVTSKLVEVCVDYIFTPGRPPPPPADPFSEAQVAAHSFLVSLTDRDWDELCAWCEPTWAADPGTEALLHQAFEAALPLSWAFRESYVPETWVPDSPLPWVVFELVVTFDMGDRRYESIPTVIRVTQTEAGWRISHLEWESAASDEPEMPVLELPMGDLSDIFAEIFGPVVITCARCEQKLSIPGDRGRLRVTCPKCHNVQWFDPGPATFS